LELVVSGSARAPGSAGFARSVSVGPPPSPGSVVAPSTATIAGPPSGTARCNNAGAPAGGESAARILSADNAGPVACGPIASADRPLDFRDDL